MATGSAANGGGVAFRDDCGAAAGSGAEGWDSAANWNELFAEMNSVNESKVDWSLRSWRKTIFTPNLFCSACVTCVKKSESNPISRKLVVASAEEMGVPERSSNISEIMREIAVDRSSAGLGRLGSGNCGFVFTCGISSNQFWMCGICGGAATFDQAAGCAGASSQYRLRSKG